MNERIKELAVEARLIASEPNGFDQNNLSKAQQKFAELIVAECARIVTDAVDHCEPASTYADKIKQHFGVKDE